MAKVESGLAVGLQQRIGSPLLFRSFVGVVDSSI